MSYVRFGPDSDIYVYAGGDHQGRSHLVCYGCALGNLWDFYCPDTFLDHMRAHVDAGHKVPGHMLDPDRRDMCDFDCDEHDHREEEATSERS